MESLVVAFLQCNVLGVYGCGIVSRGGGRRGSGMVVAFPPLGPTNPARCAASPPPVAGVWARAFNGSCPTIPIGGTSSPPPGHGKGVSHVFWSTVTTSFAAPSISIVWLVYCEVLCDRSCSIYWVSWLMGLMRSSSPISMASRGL